ncbi:hypothetical protein GQ457_05G013090 [Hibiscus cannabinus]
MHLANDYWVFQEVWVVVLFCLPNYGVYMMFSNMLGSWSIGCRKLIIETDSVDVADLFSDRHEDLNGNTITSTVRQMLNLNWEVKVCKISRVCNRVVDALAKASRGLPVGEIIYHDAPHFVHDLIFEGF